MKQAFHITPDSKAEASQQVLSIRAGEKHFGFSITTPHANELYKLAWYTDAEMDENALREIYLKHPELRDSFYQTLICYDYPQSVLVPDSHFKQDHAKVLLQTMYGVNGNEKIVTELVEGWQLQNVYALPTDVYDWTYQHFPPEHCWHAYTVGLKQVEITDFEGSLTIDFRIDDFAVIVSRANKLLLAQTFPYSTPADVIYYLLDTCRQFSFKQESVRVALSGLIAKESALYRELYQYFLHIRFREPGWLIRNGGDEYPAHFFTALNDLALCAS